MTTLEKSLRAATFAVLTTVGCLAQGQGFSQTNLVASGGGAQISDPNLLNPWGLAYSPTSGFWSANNGTGTATIYNVTPAADVTTKVALTVTIPGAGNPTGQVFNGGTGFNADRFLFVSEDGTVSGWRGALGTTAEILQTGDPDNVYKGSALSDIGGHTYLYAANFHTGAVDVLKGDPGAPGLSGNFLDPNLPAGYAPFNIQNLNGMLYVTYAKQDGTGRDAVSGAGLGIVDVFDLQGNLMGRVASGGVLDTPWGLALAPSTFGPLAGDLLVGNFGDGRISAFDPVSHAFLGQIQDGMGNALSIDGLWALMPGNDGNGGSSSRLYFTAGPNDESAGLFGVLTPVPEPGSLLALGALGLAVVRRRRSAKSS